MRWRDAAVEAHLAVAWVAYKVAPTVWWACPVCLWLELKEQIKMRIEKL